MTKKQSILHICIVISVIVLLFLAIFLPLKLTGSLDKIKTVEQLKEIILKGGAYSYLIFVLIQFVQVVLIPLPSVVTTVAGALIFGPWVTFFISFIVIILASICAFFIGKRLGRKAVVWCVGEKQTAKWDNIITRGKYVFFLMMLFPLFPDDLLCILVGTTSMSYRFFIITNLITRPITILVTCFFGSGLIIPFSGWGIPVWIALLVLCAIAMLLSFKYKDQIEKKVSALGQKLSNKH